MRSFWELVGFEYKKMLMRRGVIITLLLLFLLTVATPAMTLAGVSYVDGEPYETHYEAMVKDRAYARALSGRALDTELFLETRDAYLKIPANSDNYPSTPEYEQYARPYSEVLGVLRSVYRDSDNEAIMALTDEDFDRFYEYRRESLAERVRLLNISENAKAWLMEQDAKITTPWVFDYTEGYHRYLVLTMTTGLFTALAIAVCIAPLFAGEYSSGADQLILSSKHGKNRLVTAKLFTAVSFSAAVALLMLALTWIISMLIFGFDGADVWIQRDNSPYVAFPFTMAKAAALVTVCVTLASVFVAAITLMLSSKFKTPFGVIVIVGALLIFPMMFGVPENQILLGNLYQLLPTNIMELGTLLSYVPYDFFGAVIIPAYVFLPAFAVVASAVLLPLAGRAFRKHQIG